MGSEEKKPLPPNMVANIMWSSAKGDPKLPPLKQVCNDFPTSTTLACLNMFAKKMEGEGHTKEKKTLLKIVVEIEKRYKLKETCMRSPCPDLHRLLKEEK